MRFLDISTGDSTVSIVFEYYYKSSSNSYLNENKLGVVQKSELKDLITTAKYMEDIYFKNIYANYKDVEYKCQSGFKIGGFVATENSFIWNRYVKLSKESNSTIFLNGPEFREFIIILERIQDAIK